MKYLISILLFVSVQVSIGQTWFVSTTGTDSNTGTNAASAFATINKAISVSSCGDSIYVLAGTYHEKIIAYKICPENNRITIQGDISQRPLIIGDSIPTNKYAISASGEGFRFRHFELNSPYPSVCDQSNQIIVGNGDHFDFIDLIVRYSGYDGIKTYGDCATSNFAVNWKIIDCQILDNGLGCPSSILNGDGIDFTECRNCVIQGSVIKNNKGHQIQAKLESYNITIEKCHIEGKNIIQIGLPGTTPQCNPSAVNADSIFIRYNTILAKGDTSEFVFKLADVSNLFIENNTIIKDSINSINVGFICFGGCGSGPSWMNYPQADVVIRNNIFYSNAFVPFYYGTDTAFFDPNNTMSIVAAGYNLFYDINGEISSPLDGSPTSFLANPLFCDYPTSFKLSGSSMCINAGDPTSNPDPDSTRNDIGAIYYQGCTTGVQLLKSTKAFTIYPNPTTGILYISSNSPTQETLRIQFFSSQGQMVKQINNYRTGNPINVNSLSTGIYYVQIIGIDGSFVTQKIVIEF